MADRFGIHFGALCPPIQEQLEDQGLAAKRAGDAPLWQRMADAITLLTVQGVLTDAAARAARKRLLKRIRDGIEVKR